MEMDDVKIVQRYLKAKAEESAIKKDISVFSTPNAGKNFNFDPSFEEKKVSKESPISSDSQTLHEN